MTLAKRILMFGKPAYVACDGKCDKAWGIQSRPKIQFDPNEPDDYAFQADRELGKAPRFPGTSEGGHVKPLPGEEKLNKWCVRECERSIRLNSDDPVQIEVRDLSKRVYNQPWKHINS
jgi:hypothetical protein